MKKFVENTSILFRVEFMDYLKKHYRSLLFPLMALGFSIFFCVLLLEIGARIYLYVDKVDFAFFSQYKMTLESPRYHQDKQPVLWSTGVIDGVPHPYWGYRFKEKVGPQGEPVNNHGFRSIYDYPVEKGANDFIVGGFWRLCCISVEW